MPHPAHRTPRPAWWVAALAVTLVTAGCDAVGRYLDQSPQDRLVDEAVAQWTQRGRPFLDGVTGVDTVASVTATGARGWEVAVGPPGGGLPTVWSLEIDRADVYPLLPGVAFLSWLDARTRGAGMAEGLPPEVAEAIRTGDIRAVGDLEVRYGPANGSGRTTVARVAYLVPIRFSDATEWRVQPDSGSARELVDALRRVVDEMARTDPRMHDCLGAAPATADRAERLHCWAEVVARRFGAR